MLVYYKNHLGHEAQEQAFNCARVGEQIIYDIDWVNIESEFTSSLFWFDSIGRCKFD